MQEAWRQVFRKADSTRPPLHPRRSTRGADVEDAREHAAAAAAALTTSLRAAGLSPRAVSVASGLGAETVAGSWTSRRTRSPARGARARIRKELNRRHRQWTQELRRRSTPKRPVRVPADASVETMESVETLAARLVPAEGGPRTRPRRDIVLATLGLPGIEGAGELPPWLSQSAIAKALGVSQPTVSGNLSAAIEQWAALIWLEKIRDELVTILSEQGRVMTAQELATELRVRHTPHDEPGTEDRAGLQTQALAIVRAAAEIEARRDNAAAAEDGDADGASRFAVLRRGSTVLLALVDLPGSDDPTPVELAEYATLLGCAAEEVAARDPLPGGPTVLRELRAVPAPEGMAPLADTRLLTLAAAMTGGVGVTPRFELFPLGLGLDRALHISQAAAGVRPGIGIGPEDLLSRLRSRFPGLAALGGVTYVEWEEALAEAHFPLEYDRDKQRFYPPARDAEQSRRTTRPLC